MWPIMRPCYFLSLTQNWGWHLFKDIQNKKCWIFCGVSTCAYHCSLLQKVHTSYGYQAPSQKFLFLQHSAFKKDRLISLNPLRVCANVWSESQNLLFHVLRGKPCPCRHFTILFTLFCITVAFSTHLCAVCKYFICLTSLFTRPCALSEYPWLHLSVYKWRKNMF